jgi:hypothetical protein
MKFLEYFLKSGLNNTKHTYHKYIENYYDNIFSNTDKEKQHNILEIGVRDGSSIEIWSGWFQNSKIYGLDITPFTSDNLNVTFNQVDAYSQSTLHLFEDNFFDFIIDDGPHTVESQQYSILNWYNKLKPGGKLIIEDIGCMDGVSNPPLSSDWALEQLLTIIPSGIEYKIFDLRKTGQYDSIILEIIKK